VVEPAGDAESAHAQPLLPALRVLYAGGRPGCVWQARELQKAAGGGLVGGRMLQQRQVPRVLDRWLTYRLNRLLSVQFVIACERIFPPQDVGPP